MNCRTGFVALAFALAAVPTLAQSPDARGSTYMDFKGKMLVAISDADMVASAYIDGLLGSEQGQDALTVIPLDNPAGPWKTAKTYVGNSVTGPASAVTTTPDGRFAIVVETVGKRPADRVDPKMTDLASSRKITVVNLTNPAQPRAVQTLEGPEQPFTVTINGAGNLVAITHAIAGAGKVTPLSLYRFENGRLSFLASPSIPDWTLGDVLFDATFHPTENILALINNTKGELSLVRVEGEGNALSFVKWGNTLPTEQTPFTARFTPDGRFVLTDALYTNYYPTTPRGTISSFKLADLNTTHETPSHAFVSRISTGRYPEGLAISPDGRWAVTANLENSPQLQASPIQSFYSSLSLIRIDPVTGKLIAVGTYPFDGILPEGVVFDNSSRFVAATTYDHYDGRNPGGSIDIWRIAEDHTDASRVEFFKTNRSIPVTRGVHTLVIVR
ncbi:hypothetical protein N6P31_09335 [Pectobacterium betavasculorum]|uniref:hypothetical protein n=1 Tax=Pectobacterium betavasculorum TaxID=55207 RepID=UPI00313EF0F2